MSIENPANKFQYPNFSVNVSSISNIAEGYAYAGTDNTGSTLAAPDSYTLNNFNHFYSNIDDSAKISRTPEFLNYMNDEYYSALNSIGVTSDPSKGDNFRPIGIDASGKRLYSSQSMITSADVCKVVSVSKLLLAPTIILDTFLIVSKVERGDLKR